MEQNTLNLLIDRLERIEKQNDDQLDLMRHHIDKADAVARMVDQHQTYFKLAGSMLTLLSGATGYVLTKLGIK